MAERIIPLEEIIKRGVAVVDATAQSHRIGIYESMQERGFPDPGSAEKFMNMGIKDAVKAGKRLVAVEVMKSLGGEYTDEQCLAVVEAISHPEMDLEAVPSAVLTILEESS